MYFDLRILITHLVIHLRNIKKDIHHILFARSVGRRCAVLSSSLLTSLNTQSLAKSSDDPSFQYLVLFILVCHYFEQFDLLEEFGVITP